jgi:hypothetical protein|uniref:Uncharacterized protein n=1 Tax=Desulfobacca acetoxidans TaxID=60893 RepID=A0A7C5EMH6_9BACT
MIKRLLTLWERLRGERGRLIATLKVEFYPDKTVTPTLVWHVSPGEDQDLVALAIFLYARILFELAELNETRTAKELMAFLSQVAERISSSGDSPQRPALPLGELRLKESPRNETPSRNYQADFYRHRDGQLFLRFQGSLGKEGVYLPATYVVFVRYCLEHLENEALQRLARSLVRLHHYYRYRRDFWDSLALTAGPAFALGKEDLPPEEAEPEI